MQDDDANSDSPSSVDRLPGKHRWTVWSPWLAGLGLLLALWLFGSHFHWLEASRGPENDGFVAQAERILAGALPNDPFRPPLYAMSVAALAGVFHDAFVAGRFLSNLSAVALALLAFELGRRLRSPAVGWYALALTVVNPNFWTFGQQAATDMLFASLATGTLLGGLCYLQRPSYIAAIGTGVCYGLASFARGNAILLCAGLLLAFAMSRQSRPARSWRHAASGGACALLLLLPLFFIRYRVFGSPLYDENWKNLWWKLHGNGDWSLLARAPQTSMTSLVLHEPLAILRSTVAQSWQFVRNVLPALLSGWWTLVLLLCAVAQTLRLRRRYELYLIGALSAFTAGIAAVFFTWDRLLLLWIPIAAALSATIVDDAAQRLRATRLQHALPPLLAASLLVLSAVHAVNRLPEFLARHPYAEVELLRSVDDKLLAAESLAGTAPFLQRYLRHRYFGVPEVFTQGDATSDAAYLSGLRTLLLKERVAYLVVSDLNLQQRPKCLLAQPGSTPPAWLSPIAREQHGVLWKVSPSAARAENQP